MNFSGLASKVGGTAKEAARNGLVNGLLKLTGQSSMTGKINYEDADAPMNATGDFDGNYGGLTSGHPRQDISLLSDNYPKKYSDYGKSYSSYSETMLKDIDNGKYTQTANSSSTSPGDSLHGMLYNDKASDAAQKYNDNGNQNKVPLNPISDVFSVKLPDWSYADFINERAIWQKGLSSIFDEPGWFYFKIFFDFDTDHGLFGGLLNSKYLTNTINSAAKYLYSIRNIHRHIKPQDRINSLYKFTSILSYINTNAPWYFKSVKGLNNAVAPVIDEFSKERFIELEVTQDAIDMRLSTLMSLYNYSCYDQMTHKEIIPANLRKFNMSIILFQTPLRYLHTSYTSNKKTEFLGIDVSGLANEIGGLFGGKKKTSSKINYKTMNPNNGITGNYSDVMSMKVYTFLGCEFDKESFGNIIPNSLSNENPFKLGESTIKITYSSCYEHSMNEFYGMMFGSDGFYFNQYNNYQLTTSEGKSWNGYVAKNNAQWERQEQRYTDLVNTFEDAVKGGSILGIIDKPKTYQKAIDATEAIMNGMFDNPGLLKGLATNFALGLLGSSKSTNAPQGNIYGDYGIGSAYYKDKLEMLKNGVHERTTAPYYYDPITGVRHDLHKSKNYSAYNFKNDLTSITNFNVTNWLDTQTQRAASGINDNLRGSSNINTTAPYIPNNYNSKNAQEIDSKKWEGKGKSHEMVDDTQTWNRVEQPFTLQPKDASIYEHSKQIDVNKHNNTDIRYDEYGYPHHLFGTEEKSQFVQEPYMYNEYNRLSAQEIDSKKWEGKGKSHKMVDDPNTWDRVEQPYKPE